MGSVNTIKTKILTKNQIAYHIKAISVNANSEVSIGRNYKILQTFFEGRERIEALQRLRKIIPMLDSSVSKR